MSMETVVANKVYNIDLVVKDIKDFPQTYKSILKCYNKPCTIQSILRRKLNILFKEGAVCKTTIPGTRFGKVIFYSSDKKYNLIFESDRIQTNVYCFFDYEEVNRYNILLHKFWILNSEDEWTKMTGNKNIFLGKVLKML